MTFLARILRRRALPRRPLVLLAALVVAASTVAIVLARSGSVADEAPHAAALSGGLPVEEHAIAAGAAEGEAAELAIYSDYTHAGSAKFASVNAPIIQSLAERGQVRIAVHPVVAVDGDDDARAGALRAANAVACVAEYSRRDLWNFHVTLLAGGPGAAASALSVEELAWLARDTGVHEIDAVSSCIEAGRFEAWVLEGSATAPVTRMPTVLLDGIAYTGSLDSSADFLAFVEAQLGG